MDTLTRGIREYTNSNLYGSRNEPPRMRALAGAPSNIPRYFSRIPFRFYLFVVLAGMLVFARPAFASGNVSVIYPPPATTSPVGWGTACFEMNGQGLCGISTAIGACSYWNTQYGWSFNMTGQIFALSPTSWNCPMAREGKIYNFTLNLLTPAVCPVPDSGPPYVWNPNNGLCERSYCPDKATGELLVNPSSCTCNDTYVPDAAGTSCVPEVVCPIPALPKPPYPGDTDQACTASLEKGRGNDIDNKCKELTDEMEDETKCLADKIHALAIPYSGPSATVRTTAYQQHLLDVWKGKNEVAKKQKYLSDEEKQVCAATIADIEAHVNHHKIKSKPSDNGDDAPHVLGQAIDIPSAVIDAMIARVTNKTVVIPATCSLHCSPAVVYYRDVEDYINSTAINPPACNLRWGGRFNPYDPVHFQIP